MKKAGFTLLELIIVILLLAIMSTYVSMKWPGANINLNAQAQQLATEIQRAQNLAMSRGQRFRVNLSTSGYTITDLAGTTYYTDPVKGQNTISYPTGVTASMSASLSNNVIAFDGNGTPYSNSAATVQLTATGVISLAASGYTRTVTITPYTGRVIVQ